MEEFEIRLFDLLEAKEFEALTEDEATFVLSHITESEFRSQQRLMRESEALEYIIPVPLPLAAPRPKTVFLKRSIPLYQALLAAACIALLVYIFRPVEQKNTIQYAEKWADTISAPVQALAIHDTIVRFMEVVRFQEKLVRDTISVMQSLYSPQRETRMLEAGNTMQYPSINTLLLESNSIPLSEDKTAGLIPKIVNSGAFDVAK